MDHNKLHKDNKDHRDILKDHIERIRLYEERYQQLIYMEKKDYASQDSTRIYKHIYFRNISINLKILIPQLRTTVSRPQGCNPADNVLVSIAMLFSSTTSW